MLQADALLCFAILMTAIPAYLAVSSDEPTFNDIKNDCTTSGSTKQCAKGQWLIPISFGDSTNPGVWTQIYMGNATHPLGPCSSPAYNYCFNDSPNAIGKPVKVLETGQLKIDYQWKTSLNKAVLFNRTDQTPEKIEFKLCYSDASFQDRSWRKKNKPYPRLTANCPFKVQTLDWPQIPNINNLTATDKAALSGTIIYDFIDDTMPTSTLFVMMWITCGGGAVCAFESTESPFYSVPSDGILVYPPNYGPDNPAPYNVPGSYNGSYVQVEGYNAITPGMTAAAIILSIFGPAFFIFYYIADHMVYTKTGKPLSW